MRCREATVAAYKHRGVVVSGMTEVTTCGDKRALSNSQAAQADYRITRQARSQAQPAAARLAWLACRHHKLLATCTSYLHDDAFLRKNVAIPNSLTHRSLCSVYLGI